MNNETFELTLECSQSSFLRDHRIQGHLVFPAAGYLDLVLANLAEESSSEDVKLVSVKIASLLVLEPQRPKRVRIAFQERQGAQAFLITSAAPAGQWELNVEGQVKKTGGRVPPRVDIDPIMSRCTAGMEAEEYYALSAKAGMDYGAYYRSINRMWYNQQEVLAELVLTGQAQQDEDDLRFVLHPARVDGALQAVTILTLMTDVDAFYAPFYFGEIFIRSAPTQPSYCYAKALQSGNQVRRFDLSLCNQEGEVKVEIKNFVLKSVPATRGKSIVISSKQDPSQSDFQGNVRDADVAIIGMAGRFPQADNLEAYWENISAGHSSITEIPEERWDIDAYYDEDPDALGKTNCRCGSFLADIDKFDPMFFGISVKKAALMDPQQRIMLETAWHALEDAGYANDSLQGTRTGVYIGVSNNEYVHRGKQDLRRLSPHVAAGNTFSAIANRISYFLGLRGPSVAIDTACSSALVAIHDAWMSLYTGECDYALAGGVNITLLPSTHIVFSKAGVLSPDGCCRPFDHQASGYVRGEGVGLILLKPLKKALADGDNVHAVIKGIALNHSGRTSGFNKPNSLAQREVILEACRKSEISLDTVSYIEAHGTGTPLGDAIECRGLTAAFREHTARTSFCALGTVKGNIGHLESAAGIAAVIKVVLALKKRQIPPLASFSRPNARLNLVNAPFYMNDRLIDWPGASHARRAGVSAFGFGGTNCHLIVEEAPVPQDTKVKQKHDPLLVLSARQADTLNESIHRVCSALSDHDLDLHDMCGTLSFGRRHHPCRVAVIAKSRKECIEKLQALSLDAPKGYDAAFINLDPPKRPKIAFLFSGKSNGVLREFCDKEPMFAEWVQMCQRKLDSGLAEKLFADGTGREESDVVQSLRMFVEEYALANLVIAYGFTPDVLGGSAIGGYTASVVAGGVSWEEALNSIIKGEQINYPLTHQKPVLQVRNGIFSLDTRQDAPGISQGFSPVSATEFLKQQGYDFVISLEEIGSFSQLNHLVARGYAEGIPINWSSYHQGNVFQKVSLPLYPFKKTRYWIE